MFGDIKLDLEAIDSAIKSCAGPRGNPECLSGPFQSLRGMTSSKGADYLKGSKQVRSTLLKYSELVECIQADLCNVLKACAWIEHIDSVKSGADEETAVLFTKSLEVCLHAFHVEFRSISDYVAGIVLRLNGQKVDLDVFQTGS